MYAAIDQINIRLSVVGLEDELRRIGENQSDPHRHQYLHEVGAITNRPDQRHVDEIAENKQPNPSRKKADVRIKLKMVEKNIGGIHAHHKEGAVREVDNAHDAKNQGQTHSNHGVQRPGQQTISTGL